MEYSNEKLPIFTFNESCEYWQLIDDSSRSKIDNYLNWTAKFLAANERDNNKLFFLPFKYRFSSSHHGSSISKEEFDIDAKRASLASWIGRISRVIPQF